MTFRFALAPLLFVAACAEPVDLDLAEPEPDSVTGEAVLRKYYCHRADDRAEEGDGVVTLPRWDGIDYASTRGEADGEPIKVGVAVLDDEDVVTITLWSWCKPWPQDGPDEIRLLAPFE